MIYGAEAVSQNRRSRAGRALYEDFRKAWRRILRDVVTKLLDARLVAYGSFDSSLNTEELIPAAAWKHLSLHDLKRSTLREGRREKRRLIYSVRIYPPLEASCAPDLMIDQSIVSVIKQHVLNDPEVTSLIDRMGGDGKLAEQFLRRVPLGTCGGNDFQPFEEVSAHPRIRRLQIRCTKVLERRLYALRALLRAGKLTVLGTSAHASARSMLDPEFWNQSRTYIDLILSGHIAVFNEDFIEENLQWSAGRAKPVFYIGREQAELAAELAKAEAEIPLALPLSLTTIFGLPRSIISRSSSRATRMPESEVSATSAKLSRVQSLTTVRMRKRRPQVS